MNSDFKYFESVFSLASRVEDAASARDWPTVIGCARELSIASPGFLPAYIHNGNALLATGDHDAAMEAFSWANTLKPDDPRGLHGVCRVFQALKDYETAAESWRTFLSAFPFYYDARLHLGGCLLKLKLHAEAEQVYLEAAALRPEDVRGLSGASRAIEGSGDWERAERSWDNILTLFPNNYPAYLGRGNCFLQLGRFDDAKNVFEQAACLEPEDARGLAGVCRAIQASGDWEEAAEKWFELHKQFPKHHSGHVPRGNCLLQMQRLDEAMQEFNYMIKVSPDVPAGYLGVVRTLAQKGDIDDAVMLIEKLIARFNNFLPAYSLKGKLYELLEDFESAIYCYQHIISIDSEDIDSHLAIVRCVERKDGVKAGEIWLDGLIDLFGDNEKFTEKKIAYALFRYDFDCLKKMAAESPNKIGRHKEALVSALFAEEDFNGVVNIAKNLDLRSESALSKAVVSLVVTGNEDEVFDFIQSRCAHLEIFKFIQVVSRCFFMIGKGKYFDEFLERFILKFASRNDIEQRNVTFYRKMLSKRKRGQFEDLNTIVFDGLMDLTGSKFEESCYKIWAFSDQAPSQDQLVDIAGSRDYYVKESPSGVSRYTKDEVFYVLGRFKKISDGLSSLWDSGGNRVALFFSHAVLSSPSFFYRNLQLCSYFRKRKISYIFIDDPHLQMYLAGFYPFYCDFDGSVDFLKDIVSNKEVMTVGLSGGGISALLYGARLGAKGVINFSGATYIADDDEESRGRMMRKRVRNNPSIVHQDVLGFDGIERIENISMHFVEHIGMDKVYAERISFLKNVKLISNKKGGHDLMSFWNREILENNLDVFISQLGWM